MKAPLLALALLGAARAAAAAPTPASEGIAEPRRVLALYRPEHIPGGKKDTFFLPLHQRVELPLNHLGLFVDYLDAGGPLPGPEELRDVRGVIAWFPSDSSLEDPARLCSWLGGLLRAGKRVVLLGHLGLYPRSGDSDVPSPVCAEALELIGLRANGSVSVEPLSVQIAESDPRVVGFERKADPSETGILPLVRALPGAKVSLRLSLSNARQKTSEPVLTTAAGGVALDPFVLYVNEGASPHQFRWVLNPFAFFEAAFGLEGLPRPDVTTINGRRIYMSHVDGDGFHNLTEIDRKKTSGELFLREILERYPRSPITLSLISGYLDLSLYNDERSLKLSRAMLGRPEVEPASHGYAHPLDWEKRSVALRIPRYAMDSDKEIAGAARMLETRVLEGRRKVGLYLWTGNCLPSRDEVLIAERAGLLNMNGGGGRFDRWYPSYSYLMPLSRSFPGARQIYAPSLNENEYTELWSARFYGYRDVIETFRRAGEPRRVKPVDIYVHFYSAERYAGLEALKQVYAWAHAQPLIPVWAGRWVRAARDFFTMRVARLGPGRFRLEGAKEVRTVRFDGEPGWPDLAASRGVVGFRREGGALYVALDESAAREIVLGPRVSPGVGLEEANFEVYGWTAAGGGVRFEMEGWWPPEFTLAGLRPGSAYRVEAPGYSATLASDAQGRLRVALPATPSGRPAGRVAVEPAG